MRDTVTKLSDCSVTEYEVWSKSYQTVLVNLLELNENSNATLLSCNDLVENGFIFLIDVIIKVVTATKVCLYWLQ